MLGTYAAAVAVVVVALPLGQAAIVLAGVRRWSWLAPPVGLALLCALCWGTVRLGGDGVLTAILVPLLALAALVFLRGRAEGWGEAAVAGAPVALGALLAASLPFLVEGHFGILGTSFNPDMSQHLLAADRLADGQTSQLLHQGYPLGPHAIVVALDKGLGVGLVHGFAGLMVAVAILAPLTALAAFSSQRPLPRTAAALVVGLAYVVASYYAQGSFKETMQALFLLAFVLALRESTRSSGWATQPLRFVPAALIAVGSVYTYSFPGLIWLGATFVLWLGLDAAGGAGWRSSPGASSREEEGLHPGTGPAASGLGPAAVRSLALAALVFVVLIAPELGRMVDFHSFETFDPNGPGLGNLFGQVSPFEALGVWPSGDFRLAPGDGAVPALGYYLGIAFGLVLFAYGLARGWVRREGAILAGVGAAALAYLAARIGGTPYTAAKAIEVGSSVIALAILLPLLDDRGAVVPGMRGQLSSSRRGVARVASLALSLFLLAAGACSLLALANAPVGPTSYTPALTGLRSQLGGEPTLVLARPQLLDEQHGAPYVAWELRGQRVCIAAAGSLERPPAGVKFVVAEDEGTAPFPGLDPVKTARPFTLWRDPSPRPGESPCPLIAVRQARQGPAR